MKKKNVIHLLTVGLILSLFSGCMSSELVDIWSDTENQYPPLSKVLVITANNNAAQRRIWEDAFCVELSRHYVDAAPSYRFYPDAVPDTVQLLDLVKKHEFEGVLITRKLPGESDLKYTSGYSTTEQTTRYDRRRSRFITYYREIDHAGTVDSQKVNVHSIDLWTIKNDGQMIWSATSKTVEPNSGRGIRQEIASLVMTELTKRGIIPSRR
jgi:hypothetical protein